ncbi:unnamed protein product [Protopolystoma xenopodis]|uniref:Protein kinase domain-containing protein n=1 Tax=Protopolystoma xenopodis TaxID=117903 RepID=A0A448X456_9PLAT|nr:unnamed protein product [Protopolystoma xenopodis]
MQRHHSSGSSSGSAGGSSSNAALSLVSSSSAASAGCGTPSGGSELRLIPSDAVILLRRLGEGEFGEVYRGRLHVDNGINEEVAVKVSVYSCFLSFHFV